MSEAVKNTQLDGDVSIGRNVAIGGSATTQGDAHVKGDLTVDGWLIAKNVKFSDIKELKEYVDEVFADLNIEDIDKEWLTTYIDEIFADLSLEDIDKEWLKEYVDEKFAGIIIPSTDNDTTPSDLNIFSALRSLATFLRKDTTDSASGLIKFLAGIEIGEAIDSMLAGKGIVADANGRMQVSRLEVRESMTVQELIYNRLSAMESDYVFSESGTIETIEQTSDTTYYVVMKKDYDNDFTAIEEDDIIKGVVNNLQSATGEYYTSWCRVLSKDASANALTLVVYDDDDVSGGKNYPPTAMMQLSRWGNISDEERQSVWYLSSSEGMIVRLTGVTKPILETYNYGSTWGKTPSFLNNMGLPLNSSHDYMFARGAVLQDLIQIDYEGKPIATTVDRGVWSLATAKSDLPYLFEAYNSSTMRYESHEVWHNSIKWMCLDSGTLSEPAWNSADWSALTGSFEITITPTNGVYFFKGSNVYTTLTAKVYNGDADISADVADTQVEWTRISSKSDEDLAWGILRKDDGLALVITPDDLPSDWLETKQVSFKCTVSLLEATVVTEEFNIS